MTKGAGKFLYAEYDHTVWGLTTDTGEKRLIQVRQLVDIRETHKFVIEDNGAVYVEDEEVKQVRKESEDDEDRSSNGLC